MVDVNHVTLSQLLKGFKCESQTKNNGRTRSRGTLSGSQHYRSVELHARALGSRKKWQASITHTDLHKTNTKWLVHSWNICRATTNHGQLGHIKLTTTWTWGKPPPSPYSILCVSPRGPHPKWLFVPGLPSGSLEILTIVTLATLRAHNFLCRPLIVMKSKEKL
jgi:hypothetical protein